MLLNQTSTIFAFTKPLRRIGFCSQYLRYKVAMRIAIRHVKRQALIALWQAFNCLRLLVGCFVAGLLLYSSTSHAAEKETPQKSTAIPMDLIELLGELGDDEVALDAAMSSVESNQAAKKLPQAELQTKPVATENSNAGAKK